MRIYLTGFMGSGKSTVGRILAQQLRFPFFDLDKEIELSLNRSIEQIFETAGEQTFRKHEQDQLQKLTTDDAVIATGGGCFIHNADWMVAHGTVIYIDVPFKILAERIGASSERPLWRKAEELFYQRENQYKNAHFTVDGTKAPENVAEEIAALCKKAL